MLQARFDWACLWTVLDSASYHKSTITRIRSRVINVPRLMAQNCAIAKIEVWIWTFNARSAHVSNNKFIKETPFVCVNRNIYHYFKAIKRDKYKINTGYGVLHNVYFLSSYQSWYVCNSQMNFICMDLTWHYTL
jgi:hypothetical protein